MRDADSNFTGLPELPIEGLPADDARELLASAVRGPLDPECASGSSPRRGATCWRCSSCREG
jgi:hypothetical protein